MADERTKAKRPRLSMEYDESIDFSWLEICKYLKIEDLCELHTVNKQLRRVEEKSFYEQYQTLKFPHGPLRCCEYTLRRAICQFGHLVKSLTLRDRGRMYDVQIEAVAKYCAGTLEELELGINDPIDYELTDLVKPLFRTLKVLLIDWNYFGVFIEECLNLKTLKIYDFDGSGLTRAQNIPNLEELVLENDPGNIQFAIELLQCNPQVKYVV